jgi:hypothetical protein
MATRTFRVYTKTEGNVVGVFAINTAADPQNDPANIVLVPYTQTITRMKRYDVTQNDAYDVSQALKTVYAAIYEADFDNVDNNKIAWDALTRPGVIFSTDPTKPLPTLVQINAGVVFTHSAGATAPVFTQSQIEIVDHIAEVLPITETVTGAITGTITPITGVLDTVAITQTHTKTGDLPVAVDHF